MGAGGLRGYVQGGQGLPSPGVLQNVDEAAGKPTKVLYHLDGPLNLCLSSGLVVDIGVAALVDLRPMKATTHTSNGHSPPLFMSRFEAILPARRAVYPCPTVFASHGMDIGRICPHLEVLVDDLTPSDQASLWLARGETPRWRLPCRRTSGA